MTRSEKIARIQAVQEKLHRQATLELEQLAETRRRLADEQHAVLHALSEDQLYEGLFVDVIARRLRQLALRATEVDAMREVQQATVRERGLELKRTEKLQTRLQREERMAQEKAALTEIIELSARATAGRRAP